MFSTNAARAAIAVLSLALGFPALAQTTDKLVERYTQLAGSEENAEALVTGLREGSDITLNAGATPTTIDPPTRKMGLGNVDNALALTEASLEQQGIGDPSPEQLKAALLGVLEQRADGKGWGQIAHSLDIRLGEVKRSERAPERVARAARPDKPQRVERFERPHRPERPERARR
jgi:hypothetical protein